MKSIISQPERPNKLCSLDLWKLSFASLGIVFGDIGTSPLYSVQLIFSDYRGQSGITDPTQVVYPPKSMILGATSIVVWSLILLVTMKYVVLLLSCDFHGEGN